MKKRMALVLALVLGTAANLPAVVKHIDKDDDQAPRVEEGVYNEDYLYAGKELRFSGEAEDLMFVGGELDFSGKTKLGLAAGGGELDLAGEVDNGVIAAAGKITVPGQVTGTSYLGCGSFHLTDKGVINGDLFIGSGEVTLDGPLNGDLYAGTGKLKINGMVLGNVTAYAGRIIIGENGKINGNLTYRSKEQMDEESLARITGTVTWDEGHEWSWDKGPIMPKKVKRALGAFFSFGLLISFVIVGCLLLFLPVFRALDEKQPERVFWNTGLWGLIPVLMFPALVVLSFILIITIPFGFVLLLAALPLFFTAYVIGTTLAGKYLATKFKWNVQRRHYQFLIGALAVAILGIIPVIDFLVTLFICALGWGMFLSFLFKKDIGNGNGSTAVPTAEGVAA